MTGATAGGASATPWPVLAAAGLAGAELGVLVGSVPVAVAGLILLGGGLSGVAAEAGYGGSATRSMVAVGGLLLVVGAAVLAVRSPSPTLSAAVSAPAADGVARRGLAAAVAGGLLAGLGAVTSRLRWSDR